MSSSSTMFMFCVQIHQTHHRDTNVVIILMNAQRVAGGFSLPKLVLGDVSE